MIDEAALYGYMREHLSENRAELFDQIAPKRTNYLTVVLEDIYQAYNSNAIVRTCDCQGIQNLHIIENINPFKLHRYVNGGSIKWVDIHRHNKKEQNTTNCLNKLKKEGYTLVCTTPEPNHKAIYDLPIDKKIALVFGNEKEGVSDEVKALADEFITIPMYGFTESLNLSVSVALCLYDLNRRIRQSNIDWKISEKEQVALKLKWARKSIKKVELIEAHYIEKITKSIGN